MTSPAAFANRNYAAMAAAHQWTFEVANKVFGQSKSGTCVNAFPDAQSSFCYGHGTAGYTRHIVSGANLQNLALVFGQVDAVVRCFGQDACS